MTVIRWKPVRDISRWSPVNDLAAEFLNMQKDIDRMYDRYPGDARCVSQCTDICPSVDVVENDGNFIVNAELPGVGKSDVKITVVEGVLTIRGEKKQETEGKGDNFHRIERSFGSFERSFTLPTAVQSDKIEADFSNGILTISIPKSEQAKTREIEVKVK
ncbi:MAG TPA: Hsp20/alpha crystallin family protein [Bacteroidota bacterium]|nr:Hsp20/alpha crystallin family protein [Bacteroidota bacterium]